ncbi:MAG: hypothetical protein KAJ97_05835 [Acidobacteria bacterium]|nr:hypothetical protein [Acidobacteriota bacterium]
MRAFTPVVVLLLVTGWLLAVAFDQPLLAALVAVLCLGAVCADAVRRRAPARPPAVALTAILVVLGGFIGLLLLNPPGGAGGFLAQIAVVAVLAPVVPLVYALTFGGEDRGE